MKIEPGGGGSLCLSPSLVRPQNSTTCVQTAHGGSKQEEETQTFRVRTEQRNYESDYQGLELIFRVAVNGSLMIMFIYQSLKEIIVKFHNQIPATFGAC